MPKVGRTLARVEILVRVFEARATVQTASALVEAVQIGTAYFSWIVANVAGPRERALTREACLCGCA